MCVVQCFFGRRPKSNHGRVSFNTNDQTQPPTVYTTTNPHGDAENAMATRVPLPMDERNAKLLRLKGAYGCTTQAGSGAPAVWKVSFVEPGGALGMSICAHRPFACFVHSIYPTGGQTLPPCLRR